MPEPELKLLLTRIYLYLGMLGTCAIITMLMKEPADNSYSYGLVKVEV